jgi:Domain of unknown function (DUF5666)
MKVKNAIVVIFFPALIANAGPLLPPAFCFPANSQGQEASQNTIARRIGTIKTINGSAITLAPDSGPPVAVTVEPNARILRLASGEKDLKNATPVQLQDLQVGDTIRVRGYASADGQSISGLEVIVITRAAVQAVSEQIRQDWQKRGVGGVVDFVDPATGTITLSVPGLTGKKTIVVHTSKNTIVRRYAPDSAKPEDAKTTTLQGIQVGDQLRARGDRNADGTEVTAEEIYTGVFPRWVGTIKSIDASAGTLTVQDLATKKTVQVRVTADSQLHRIPAEMAQRFAMRLRSMQPPGTPGAGASSQANSPNPGNNGQGAPATAPQSARMGPGGGMGMRPGGAPDFQQIVNRLPSSTLADLQLQKGDAVVILATEGTPSSAPAAITLLSGVEPILQAAPNGSQAMMLAPWSLGGAPGGGDAQQ